MEMMHTIFQIMFYYKEAVYVPFFLFSLSLRMAKKDKWNTNWSLDTESM